MKSVGIIERIGISPDSGDMAAFGEFNSGPKSGTTFDLPQKFQVDNEEFEIEVGDFVVNMESVDDLDAWMIMKDYVCLIIHINEDDEIEHAQIMKKLN